MKMRVLLVDNQKEEDDNVKNIRKWVESENGSSCTLDCKNTFSPQLILAQRPDLVLLDVALDSKEEKYFDGTSREEIAFDPTREISGIKYCRELKANFADLPVILTSNYANPKIMAAALNAGADGFINKDQATKDSVVAVLAAAFTRSKTDDIALYEKLRLLLEDTSTDVWQRDRMLQAMDAFFVRGSGIRRLTGLWCSLAELVEELIPHDVGDELLWTLMDTDALLLAANPRMRDHVRHAGNVFWIGYYFLNRFDWLTELPSKNEAFRNESVRSSLPTRNQLNLTWVLASLLHDVGYVWSRITDVESRLKRGKNLFWPDATRKNVPLSSLAPAGLEPLQEYFERLGLPAQRLYSAINTVLEKWARKPGVSGAEDHGLASASAFLSQISRLDKNTRERPEVLHAAASIALHNLAKWNVLWQEKSGPVTMPLELLPCAWLLGYCDELQGWGREPSRDPFNVDQVKGIEKAREEYARGYLKGSRLARFDATTTGNVNPRARVSVEIQYMMVHGENTIQEGREIRSKIQEWHRDRAPALRWTLGLDNILETTLVHRVPAPVGDSITINLDGREKAWRT